MKKILLLFFISFIQIHAYSQHQTDNWFFGTYAGLNFSSGTPVVLTTGALSTTEGCSSISDAQGNLLFYTNGVSVWNRNNEIMPNGDSLKGDISSTQSALIVPAPGSSDYYYYIFTQEEIGGEDGFQYSIVDMTQDSGLGDLITKNVFIQDSLTEKVAAQKHSNGLDYWVVVHQWGTNAFFAYTLTSAGVQGPVISNVGIVHNTSLIQNTYGQMKFSTCSDKLALAAGYLDTVELFDFDPSTGIVSNPITLPMNDHVYGVEFSPAGNLLYVTTYDASGTLLQFDLSSNNANAIMASKTVISSMDNLYALQLGPDYKIYVTQSFSSQLGVINDPNVPGPFCNWDNAAVNLDPNYMGTNSAIGLPEFVQTFFKTDVSCVATTMQEIPAVDPNRLFPNPSSGEFTVDLSNYHSPSTVMVRNEEGKIMAKFAGISPEKFSFGKNFPAGIYTVHVQNDSGSTSMMAVKVQPE